MFGIRTVIGNWSAMSLAASLVLSACTPVPELTVAPEEAVAAVTAGTETGEFARESDDSAILHRLDCAGNPRALWEAEPVVQHHDGDEIHQYWLLADQPDLWGLEVPELEPLIRYRDQVRKALPDTSPLEMIRTNRERNAWIDEEFPNEDRVNRQVEAGVGRHRPMNCLESHILAYQAARFPLYEQPSEVVALFVKRSEAPGGSGVGNQVKVYLAADDDSVLPKPKWAVESVEADVAAGWRFAGVFHNHTFDHAPDRGLIPVASPSTSDLQVSVALEERLGLEAIQVSDGFSTLELTAAEFEGLYRSLEESTAADESAAERAWPQWRGPLATGVAPRANPPLEWSEEKNLRWKVALPGKGHSTPVVWGDRLFVTAAIPYGEPVEPIHADSTGAHDNLVVTRRYEFVVMAIARDDGRVLWRRTVHKGLPHEMGHETASLASASPSTDGEQVFASFGSYGLYALSVDGDLAWSVEFGRMRTKHAHGEGSSPVLYGDTLVVNWDHEEGSFVTALDKKTGTSRWRVERDEVTSWATPIVVEHKGRKQVIVPGTKRLRSYDLATGEVIWECAGLSANIVASPVAHEGMVYAASSYDTRALLAIRLEGARGDITGTEQVAWRRSRGTPYVPSLLVSDGVLYFLSHYQGVLTRLDARTGEERPGTFRLPSIGNVYASPVAAAGRVYITDRTGTTVVISDEDEPRVLAINELEGTFSASAALVDGELYLRSEDALYCIVEDANRDRRPQDDAETP